MADCPGSDPGTDSTTGAMGLNGISPGCAIIVCGQSGRVWSEMAENCIKQRWGGQGFYDKLNYTFALVFSLYAKDNIQ